MLQEERRHLHFVVSLYHLQLREGRHVLHEHPAGAKSWHDSWMMNLTKNPNVHVVVSDQCEYGPRTRGVDGRLVHEQKPTKWATSSIYMADRLKTLRSRTHTHQHLEGNRAAAAAFYPTQLITEILRGIRDTADAEQPEADPDHLRPQTLPSHSIRSVRPTSTSHDDVATNGPAPASQHPRSPISDNKSIVRRWFQQDSRLEPAL